MTTLQVVGTQWNSLSMNDADNLLPFEDTIISAEQVFDLIAQLDTNKAIYLHLCLSQQVVALPLQLFNINWKVMENCKHNAYS